jgi:hypothetical protein
LPGVAPAAAVTRAEAEKAWAKGISTGLVTCAAIGAAAAFVNDPGYHQGWVILEGLPLGLAAGYGLWAGVKTIRPLPGRTAVVLSALVVTILCCLGVFGLRTARKGGIKNALVAPASRKVLVEKADYLKDAPPPPKDFAESPVIKEMASRAPYMDVDQISALIYVVAHWLLTDAMAMLVVWLGFSRIARQEAAVQLQRQMTAGTGEG